MLNIEAELADIDGSHEKSFYASSPLLRHGAQLRGVSLSRNRCEAVMASVFNDLIPLLGVISVFIAICSLEGVS